MSRIQFTSVLGSEYRRQLERLLFFNPQQHRARAAILEAIEGHGVPQVVLEDGRLRVKLDSGCEVQTLFAVDHRGLNSKLAGVMVYTRSDLDTLLLLHIAVAEDHLLRGRFGEERLVERFVGQLREIAARVNGVRTVRLVLGRGKLWDLAI